MPGVKSRRTSPLKMPSDDSRTGRKDRDIIRDSEEEHYEKPA